MGKIINLNQITLGLTNLASAVIFSMKGTPFYHNFLLFRLQLRFLDQAIEVEISF
jgi:hypothetical protein